LTWLLGLMWRLPAVRWGDATFYTWRKKFGSMGRSQLSELKALEKENQRLKKIVADLELDKLILKESLDFLKPRA
jgi:putative transposase